MAAPLYMLIIVNERARFGVPPGHDTDRYMENIISRQPLRCYAYLTVVFITGFFLFFGTNLRISLVADNWPLLVKLGAFAVLVSLLSSVHFGIQPKIEVVLSKLAPGKALAEGDRLVLVRLRTLRKRLSGLCLLLVLTEVVMGVRVFALYDLWLTIVFLAGATAFAWRVYRKPIRFGWF